jgi:hypothetical protein
MSEEARRERKGRDQNMALRVPQRATPDWPLSDFGLAATEAPAKSTPLGEFL